jgi:hypothetical protein
MSAEPFPLAVNEIEEASAADRDAILSPRQARALLDRLVELEAAQPPATPALPQIDAARLIADVRRRDEKALDEAYRLTFGGELGRLVLADHLVSNGVGRPLGREATPYDLGAHDAALFLASCAGFDEASVAVAVLTDNLEGPDYERRARYDFADRSGDDLDD